MKELNVPKNAHILEQGLEHARIELQFGEKERKNQTVGRQRPVNQAWSKMEEEKVKAVSERSKRNENQPLKTKHEAKRKREIAEKKLGTF